MISIGILLDPDVFRCVPSGRTGHERLDLYRRAARKLHVKLVFMSLDHIDYRNRRAVCYVWFNNRYKRTIRNIPSVIHNRAMPFGRARHKLRKLAGISCVFNGQNRNSKYKIHRLLRGSSTIRNHLPVTRSLTAESLRAMAIRYSCLFIKPQNGSLGKRILRASRVANGTWVIRTGKRQRTVRSGSLYKVLHKQTGGRPYLVQQEIKLSRYRRRPYDLRVSVQRASKGSWQVTGIVGKVAGRGMYVTNVASGGTVKRSDMLLSSSGLPIEPTLNRIRHLSLNITSYLSRKLDRLADVGLDIGVDQTGKPYFIEMNGRDQRYSFRNAGLIRTYNTTYENPIRYAAYLARRR